MKNVNLPFWTIFPMGGGVLLVLVALVLLLARGCSSVTQVLPTATHIPMLTPTATQVPPTATHIPLYTPTATQIAPTATMYSTPSDISLPEGWEFLMYQDSWYIQKDGVAIKVADLRECPGGVKSPCWDAWGGINTFDRSANWISQMGSCPVHRIKTHEGEISGMQFPFQDLTCYELRSP